MRNLLYWLYINICCARRTAKKDLQARTFEWREPISERQREAIERLLTEERVHVHRNPPKKERKTRPAIVGSVHGAL
jgi:hypothetical protein